MLSKVCGIDFGTSNSACAVANQKRDQKIELIPVEDGKITTPSALFFDSDENDIYFGRAAQKAYMDGFEGRFMRSLKRVLGTGLMADKTVVNGRATSFQNIIGAFLKNMKKQTEDYCGFELNDVVMGRPVYFVDNNETANQQAQNQLEEISKSIGFNNVDFQFEPIAAAFAHERNLSGEKLAFVVDIGGGTSDFTVIRLAQERLHNINRTQDILANTGVRIGGNDFDKDLSVKIMMPHMGYNTTYGEKNLTMPKIDYHDLSEWSKINIVYAPKTVRYYHQILRQSHEPEKLKRFVHILEAQLGHRLLHSTEMSKIELTNSYDYNIGLDYVEESLSLSVTRDDLNKAISATIDKVICHVYECVKLAQVRTEDVNLIILTGGSTEIPYVQMVLSKIFPHAEISQGDKLSSVALGLAYDARRKFL